MLWILLGSLVLLVALVWFMGCRISSMPGESHAGPLPPLTGREKALQQELERDVYELAAKIGPRNVYVPGKLATAAAFIEEALQQAGYDVGRQDFLVGDVTCRNLDVEIRGTEKPDEILVVGAHYDSVPLCPAANDNGSGVAALLALARALRGRTCTRTLRLVAFTNEEPPHFWSESMGSLVYAKRCKARGEKIVGMMSLETIAFYSDEPGSQSFPFPLGFFYPSRGDFIAFVGNTDSGDFIREVVGSFRRHARFPSEGAALPGLIPQAGWSDQWAFWQQGYPGLMVTDTAPFRYPHYHTREDTHDKLDYERFARVVAGLEKVVAELVGATTD